MKLREIADMLGERIREVKKEHGGLEQWLNL